MKPCAMPPMRRRMVISGSLDLHGYAAGRTAEAKNFQSEGSRIRSCGSCGVIRHCNIDESPSLRRLFDRSGDRHGYPGGSFYFRRPNCRNRRAAAGLSRAFQTSDAGCARPCRDTGTGGSVRAVWRGGTRAGAFWRMHIYLLGALTSQLNGHTLANLSELADAGCVGFSNADAPLADTQVLWRALQYASTFDLAIWLRPQDAALSRHGVAASGEYASRLGLPDVPEIAETIALDTIFELMRATGARVHLSHLSSAAGLERVRSAKREGLPLSCDVTLNQRQFVDTDIGAFNPLLRLDPPLRGARDRASIRAALADGTIDAICSAHTPVHDDAKKQPFGEAAPGAVGLELLLSMTVKWAEEEHIPLVQALAKVTCAPADVLGLKIGRIEIGQAADLTLFDPHARWRVTPEALKGQSRNTPFLGYEASARVRSVIISGRIVFKSEG